MKKQLSIALILTLVILIGGWFGFARIPMLKLTQSEDSVLQIGTSHAADSQLRAGMVDPKTGKKIKYWVAPMDPAYIRQEPGKSPMGMDLVPVYEEAGGEKEPSSTIRIDPVTVQNMGVRLGKVVRKPMVKHIRTVGNITYDETRIHTVTTKFSGWIEELYVDFVGEKVRKGQPLFDIYSPELVTAQEELLLAVQQYESLKDSVYPSVRDSARRLLKASRTRLRYWDLTDGQIEEIEKSDGARKLLTIYSPASGVIIKKQAFQGHHVKTGAHQYEIADLSNVWVDVEIYEYELPFVRKGMMAEMALSYVPGTRFAGKVLYIYPFLSPKTRTARLRLSFPNAGYQLKPDMYADIYLTSATRADSLVIPQEAVIDSGIRKVVFVALGKGRFQPREIQTGVEGSNHEIQVLEGLSENEDIVLSGQFLLDSESRLQEAVQKMLEVQQKSASADPDGGMKDMPDPGDDEMEMDDLDMSDMTMD